VGLVTFACFQTACPVFCFAWDVQPDRVTNLTSEEFDLKKRIMLEVYGAEVKQYNLQSMILAWEGFIEMQKHFLKPRLLSAF